MGAVRVAACSEANLGKLGELTAQDAESLVWCVDDIAQPLELVLGEQDLESLKASQQLSRPRPVGAQHGSHAASSLLQHRVIHL